MNRLIQHLPRIMWLRFREEALSELGLAPDKAESQPLNFRQHLLSLCASECAAINDFRVYLPIVGFLYMRRKCSACAEVVTVRVPLVEIATPLLLFLSVLLYGPTIAAVAMTLCLWVLLSLACMDAESGYLPDQLTLPFLWAGLCVNMHGMFVPIESAVSGAVAGYMSLWLLYWIYRYFMGQEGMGYGDFKLFAALGAWFGWMALPGIALIGVMIGLFYAFVRYMIKGVDGSPAVFRFGPCLAVAGAVTGLLPMACSDCLMAPYFLF